MEMNHGLLFRDSKHTPYHYVHLCWYTSMILSRKDMCGNFIHSKQVESGNIRGGFF